MTCNRFTAAEYAFYAAGTLDNPEQEELRTHLRSNCPDCVEEVQESLSFWYSFSQLTEKTQAFNFPEPTADLRQRVIGIVRSATIAEKPTPVKDRRWLRIAAGILLAVGGASAAWMAERFQADRQIAAVRVNIDKQAAELKKKEAENVSLRNLVVAARNAPAVFPGKESIVSVQDPYLMRSLQQSRQNQVAISQALTSERGKASALEAKLTQTTGLLAVANKDKEDADRQYKQASNAALERDRGISKLSLEINAYKAKVHDWETELARSRTTIKAQTKALEQRTQIISLLESGNTALIPLKGGAGGVALIADNSRVAIFPGNLPAAPAGRSYQLWMMGKGTEAVSLGTFNVSKDANVYFTNKPPTPGMQSLVVTEEPAAGSTRPTGTKILIGASK